MKSHKERAMAHYLAQNQHIASPCSAARSEDRRIRRAARAHQRSCRQGSRLCLAAQVGIGQRHRHRLRQSFRDRQHARSGSKRWISPVIVSGGFPPVTSPPSPKAASGGNTTRSAARLRTPSSQLLAEYHRSRDPDASAPYGVSWAGEEKSSNWFDTAREFTERWHHQQQIRLAVNKPGIMTRELYHPVLDCFLRALPFTYRTVSAKPGTYVQFNISGECGGSWYLYRAEESWQLAEEPVGEKTAETTIPQEIAWRIFTKGIDRESALPLVKISGDTQLGLHALQVISIVA